MDRHLHATPTDFTISYQSAYPIDPIAQPTNGTMLEKSHFGDAKRAPHVLQLADPKYWKLPRN
jgi:hypothetical protein